jgi:hypothetical protein
MQLASLDCWRIDQNIPFVFLEAEEMEGRTAQARGRRLFGKTYACQQAINAKLALSAAAQSVS